MKLKNPLVSILINNYNNEKYCIKSIQSALKQNYNRIEIIFYDDYSSDNSLDKVKKIKNNKLKIIENRSRGKKYSLNQLQAIFSSLQKSKGEIVCILDSDDFFKKDKVKKIVSFFNKNKNEEILFDKPINYYGENKKIESNIDYRKRLNKWPVFPPTSCISIRSKSLKKIKKIILVKKFQELWFDFRVAAFYALKKGQLNIFQEHLTYYRNYSSSHDKKYKKLINKAWWNRRHQAFEFVNYIDKKKYKKNKLTLDYLLTKFISFF